MPSFRVSHFLTDIQSLHLWPRQPLNRLEDVGEGKKGFKFTADRDGEYEFSVQFWYASGDSSPAPAAPSGTAFVPHPAAQSASASSASSVGSPATTVPAAAAPNVTLKILGYVDKPGAGREIVISDDYEVYVTHEGETFAERFKVLKITPATVDILDTKNSLTVRLDLP